MIDLKDVFDQFESEYGHFERITNPKHPKRDLCAMLMLDELVAGTGKRIIACSSHDEVYLAIDCDELRDKLAELGTEDVMGNVTLNRLVRDLVRCGVIYDQKINSLYIFT